MEREEERDDDGDDMVLLLLFDLVSRTSGFTHLSTFDLENVLVACGEYFEISVSTLIRGRYLHQKGRRPSLWIRGIDVCVPTTFILNGRRMEIEIPMAVSTCQFLLFGLIRFAICFAHPKYRPHRLGSTSPVHSPARVQRPLAAVRLRLLTDF